MKTYEIWIDETGFVVSLQGEQIANSGSGNDLLAIFNQILGEVSPGVKVRFE